MTRVIVRSAHPFSEVRVKAGGEELLLGGGERTGSAGASGFPEDEGELPVAFGEDGKAHLVVSAKWPAGTPETALLVQLEPPGQPTLQKTLWGEGELSGEVEFRKEGDDE